MPRYRKEVDVTRTAGGLTRGSEVRWEYTYKAQGRAFHEAIKKRTDQFFDNFRGTYARRVPKRTGRLSRGFNQRGFKQYGQTISVNSLNTDVPYAYVVEHGGRGRHHAGTRRAGHIRRIFGTERRKLVRDVRQRIVPGIYGTR